MSEAQKPVEAIGSQCANSPSGSSILKIDAVVRDRIYVSSRTQKPKNGVFANGVESIYGLSTFEVTYRRSKKLEGGSVGRWVCGRYLGSFGMV